MSTGPLQTTNEGTRIFYCPGCECGHELDARWTVTGPDDRPTASPSVLHVGRPPQRYGDGTFSRAMPTCHLFIRDGQLQFLSDCTHALAGQTVPMDREW